MSQTAVSESVKPGARQSSPPPSSNQKFKYRNIEFIRKAAPQTMPLFSPFLDEEAHKQMAAQVLDALFEHKVDLLSLFTDEEQIRVVFKRKIQRNATCALRLYGLVLVLGEVRHLDEKTRQRLLDVLKVVETDFPNLINPEEIADLKQKIASA